MGRTTALPDGDRDVRPAPGESMRKRAKLPNEQLCITVVTPYLGSSSECRHVPRPAAWPGSRSRRPGRVLAVMAGSADLGGSAPWRPSPERSPPIHPPGHAIAAGARHRHRWLPQAGGNQGTIVFTADDGGRVDTRRGRPPSRRPPGDRRHGACRRHGGQLADQRAQVRATITTRVEAKVAAQLTPELRDARREPRPGSRIHPQHRTEQAGDAGRALTTQGSACSVDRCHENSSPTSRP